MSAKEAEFIARKGLKVCGLCPHLGVGDPLVDEQAKELVETKKQLERALNTIAAYEKKNESP